jgi:hypothetical protein
MEFGFLQGVIEVYGVKTYLPWFAYGYKDRGS